MTNSTNITNITNSTTPTKRVRGTPRPRKPISIDIAALPDEALVDKHVRRALTGLGDSETYERITEGRFPAPLKLGLRCSRWRMSSLRAWLADPINWSAGGAA